MEKNWKWGSNEGIRIGDIYEYWYSPYIDQADSNYYQVVALRGRTQVVLRPLRMEQDRPLPGQFMTASELTPQVRYERGKEIRRTGEEVIAWVLPYKTAEGEFLLSEVRWRAVLSQVLPEDREPGDTEAIKQMEEEYLQARKELAQRWLGEQRGLELWTKYN